MKYFKKLFIILSINFLVFLSGVVINKGTDNMPRHCALADKEQYYTSDEEFLPLGINSDEDGGEEGEEFFEDENLIKNAKIGGIKLLKEKRQLVFTITADNGKDIDNKELKYDIYHVNFPPRIILHFYGVTSEERVYHFFKNLEILGLVLNPFVRGYATEYVVFFKNWTRANEIYNVDDKQLILEYEFVTPDYERGYGVRIADTKIDPLPQVVEIEFELKRSGLECYLLIASDYETIVLESPFYETKDEAAEYMESLQNFGYKGKLAIRNYMDFPKPHRFDVVSEIVITGNDSINLRNIVYAELKPRKIYGLSYSDIFLITKDIFSPQIRSDEDLIAEYYYKLSEIYRDFETDDSSIRRMAYTVSVKIFEVIYFTYPESQRADDSLWEIAQISEEYGIVDIFSKEECYKKILDEYPESIFAEEVKIRVTVP